MEASLPDSSSGNYSRPAGNIPVTGQTVQAIQVNAPIDDLSAAMSRRYMRDGRTPMLGNVPMNGYRVTGAANAVDAADYVTLAQVQALLATIATIPTGVLLPLTSLVVPTGWLIVNGQEVSRTTYASLWAHAQASSLLAASEGVKGPGQFGPGNGSTTFTLPNLYADGGYFIRPISSGRAIGSVQADDLKSHTHGGSIAPAGAHNVSLFVATGGGGGQAVSIQNGSAGSLTNSYTTAVPDHTHGLTINATGGTETRPKNIAYPVLIKT